MVFIFFLIKIDLDTQPREVIPTRLILLSGGREETQAKEISLIKKKKDEMYKKSLGESNQNP